MTLLKRERESFVFHLGRQEKELLLEVLKLYPSVATTHHRLSRTSDARQIAEHQKMLEEALAERKQENRRLLFGMLEEYRRFQEVADGYRFILKSTQVDWLLQVLNDIRVGSWLTLGEPDERNGRPARLEERDFRHFAAMEFCGYLQMTLLNALHGEE